MQPDTRQTAPTADLKQVVREQFSYVRNSLRRLGVGESDLDDMAQEVFLTFYRRLDDFDAERALRPWLFGIAYRTAGHYHRARKRSPEVAEVPGMLEQGAITNMEEQEARELVVQALQFLDLDKRAVFVMHEIDGYSMPDAARALDLPLNTAYSRLRLAREKFTQAVLHLNTRETNP